MPKTTSPVPLAALEGDFYVKPDCCIICGVPEQIAPELFHTGAHQCSVIRQPCSTRELDKMIHAMWAGEVDCIRYRGRSETIIERLSHAGMTNQVDFRPPSRFAFLLRDRVHFDLPESSLFRTDRQLARAFRTDMRSEGCKILPAFLGQRSAWISWFGNRFHLVHFRQNAGGKFRARILSMGATVGLAWRLDDWLRAQSAKNLTWRAGDDLSSTRETPI